MATHSRKPSVRAALPRRSTRGPLDADDDPLSPSSSLASSTIRSPEDALPPSTLTYRTANLPPLEPAHLEIPPDVDLEPSDRDLSFLLQPSIYHPLSQLDIPAPFRKPFPPPVNPSSTSSATLTAAFKQLDDVLSDCEYLLAAHLAGLVLISGPNVLSVTDQRSIFRLLSIRYACLELSGNVALAAQEAKALEDLGSNFYYADPPTEADAEHPDEAKSAYLPKHIAPWYLRLQALRLQSIGFSDPRRGVSALYDLATECREYLATPTLTEQERQLWAARLEEVGMRVVNALIEMGDLDCARRTLGSMTPSSAEATATWALRKATLCLKMGLLPEARGLVEAANCADAERQILRSLLAVAEGDFDVAIELLKDPESKELGELAALAKQNLAVALLYRGDIQKARDVLDELVEEGHSFQTLTINLATIYDLTTDRSRELKLTLVDKVAQSQREHGQTRAFNNVDFKL